MRRIYLILAFFTALAIGIAAPTFLLAKTASPSATPNQVSPSPTPFPDITQKTQETLGPLEELLKNQKLGPVWPSNPIKYAIRGAIKAGVPANMIVLLVLLPLIAMVIAASRHLIGLRGFGIFLPAALSVVFVATGPIVGIGLFLLIIATSTLTRISLRKLKIKLQYLPRTAFMLWLVSLAVLGILFLAPIIKSPSLANVSIFPILILALLAEDFTRVQLGKSGKTAINLTSETIILSLISYLFLTLEPIREFALLNPELILISVGIIDLILGKYVGLRLMEIWRFRKLLRS